MLSARRDHRYARAYSALLGAAWGESRTGERPVAHGPFASASQEQRLPLAEECRRDGGHVPGQGVRSGVSASYEIRQTKSGHPVGRVPNTGKAYVCWIRMPETERGRTRTRRTIRIPMTTSQGLGGVLGRGDCRARPSRESAGSSSWEHARDLLSDLNPKEPTVR